MNLAVARYGADREWLLRVDAHCSYPANYARRLVKVASEQRASSVVVPMVTRGKSCFQIAAAAAQNSIIGTGGSPHRHVGQGSYVDHGHHALMRMSAFRSVEGYREDMVANEDAELDYRLINSGERIWLEPDLALAYSPRATPPALWRQYLKYGRGRARTLLIHHVRPKLRQIAPLTVPLAFALALLAPISFWLAAPLVCWAGLLAAASVVIGVRERSRCALLSGAAAGIMHLAWSLGLIAEFISKNGLDLRKRVEPTVF